MNNFPQAPATLCVSLVLYHTPLEILASTVKSLDVAVASALEDGCLAAAELVVIDNSLSTPYSDEARQVLASALTETALAWSFSCAPVNGGYSGGHNYAINASSADYCLVLNPDVELGSQVLSLGLRRLQGDSQLALLSPEVRRADGEQEFLCKRFPSVLVLALRAFAPGFIRRLFQRQLDDYEMRDLCSSGEEADVVLASGCFMLMRGSDLRAAGGFNEQYFLYFEDFDLSMRLQQQGRLVFSPQMKIVHHGGYAARKGSRHLRYFITSGRRFFDTYGWRWI